MSKFGELMFALFIIWVGWIFLGGTGQGRLDRACRPVEWTGNVTTSLAAYSFPSTTKGVQRTFKKADYFCEYSLWRLFFEDQYKAYLVEQERLDAEALEQQRRDAGLPPAPKADKKKVATVDPDSGSQAPPKQEEEGVGDE